MEKLKLQTTDMVDENVKRIGELFPNCLTETKDENGQPRLSIDFDQLRQELSHDIVEGPEERYQFTWPDKRNAIRLANAPINDTLRPVREDETTPTGADSKGKSYCSSGSVNFDTTQNLYIEGDNLQVLKLLREDYLGKIKMIYIDPPYNTGNDFVYRDDFSQSAEEYAQNSGQTDEEGNRLFANTESNGRFHTDWLNMIYPRLKVAKDLLSDDGVIFISIDDNEVENLKKLCNEVFGEHNFVSILNWRRSGGRQDSKYYAVVHEYILCYAKKLDLFHAGEEIKQGDIYPKYDEQKQRYYKTQLLRKWGSNSLRENRPNLYYPIKGPDGSDVYPTFFSVVGTPSANDLESKIQGCWRWGKETMAKAIADGCVEFQKDKHDEWIAYEKIFAPKEGEEKTKKYTTWIDDVGNGTDSIKKLFTGIVFEYSKSSEMIMRFLKMAGIEGNDIVLDFFSGSATTAHAVMQLNAEDGGNRKFIMVQLPEATDEKSEAYKAGYKNICEIGKERIRRAGKKIKEESPLTTQDLDIGFRVLKLDSSNMEDVYVTPEKFTEGSLFVNNIKSDRSEEDLLFQVMIEMGIALSSKIERMEIAGKTVWDVAQNYLLACFDEQVNETAITEIAKRQPQYFVMRDSSLANDQVADNFEQIWKLYSADTERRIV